MHTCVCISCCLVCLCGHEHKRHMDFSQGAPLLTSQGHARVKDTDEVALLSHPQWEFFFPLLLLSLQFLEIVNCLKATIDKTWCVQRIAANSRGALKSQFVPCLET